MSAPQPPQGWYPDPDLASGQAPAREALAPRPQDDPFYTYSGSTPLASIPPGTVLATRSIAVPHIGHPDRLKTTQLLYRSTSQTGKPTVNVTSVDPAVGPARQDESAVVPVRL